MLLRGKSRGHLKEKFVVVYDAIFRGKDPSGGRGDAFWDEGAYCCCCIVVGVFV